MVEALLYISKTDKELRLDLRFLLRLVYCLYELRFVELLAGHGYYTIDLGYHVHGRRLAVESSDLDEVVHVIAVQAGIGGYVGTVAFAEFEFVDLEEVLVGLVDFIFRHKLVVMEVGEEHALVRIVKREAEAALGSDISEFLIEGLVPVEGIHVLIHIDLGIAALPCREVLQPRPIVFGQQSSVLLQQLLEFLCSFGFGEHVWFERLAYIVRDVELVAECAVGYIHYEFVGMFVNGTHKFENG